MARVTFVGEDRPDIAVELHDLRARSLPRQPRRGNHLHGFGDLLRVAHRANAPPHVNQAGHRCFFCLQRVLTSWPVYSICLTGGAGHWGTALAPEALLEFA